MQLSHVGRRGAVSLVWVTLQRTGERAAHAAILELVIDLNDLDEFEENEEKHPSSIIMLNVDVMWCIMSCSRGWIFL